MEKLNKFEMKKQEILSNFQRSFPEAFASVQNGIFTEVPETRIAIVVSDKGTVITNGK